MSITIEAPCLPDQRPRDGVVSVWTRIGKRLSRTTSSGRVIPAIDGLRSLAILAVIMHHLGGYVAQRTPGLSAGDAMQSVMYRLTNAGNCGVQLFFVISGFILALPFAEQHLRRGKPVRLTSFYGRRLARLHTPYLVNLTVLALLSIAVKREPCLEIAPHFLASSLYLHNLIYHSMSTVNGVAWSLEIEVQFYLLAPLLALVFRISNPVGRRSLICGIVVLLVLLKRSGGMGVPFPLSGSVFYFLDFFLCGLLLADWHVTSAGCPTTKRLTGLAWDCFGGLSLVGSTFVVRNDSTVFLLPFLFLSVCAAVLQGPRLNRLFSLPVLATVGGMCLTIYLYHFGVISLVGRVVAPLTLGFSYSAALTLQTAIVVPSILCVSAALFLLTEKPFMACPTR